MSDLDPRSSGIYQITLAGRRYIGSALSIKRRWQAHMRELSKGIHHSRFLQAAFKKHGKDALNFTVLEFVYDVEFLLIREQHWIDKVRPEYNSCMTAGSRRGSPVTAETREKLSSANKGRTVSVEHRRKLSEALLNHAVSNETRAKISAAGKGRPMTAAHRARLTILLKGKPKSAEHRAKLAIANTGKKHSLETRQKISALQLGKKRGPHSAEHRQAISDSHKRRYAQRKKPCSAQS